MAQARIRPQSVEYGPPFGIEALDRKDSDVAVFGVNPGGRGSGHPCDDLRQ